MSVCERVHQQTHATLTNLNARADTASLPRRTHARPQYTHTHAHPHTHAPLTYTHASILPPPHNDTHTQRISNNGRCCTNDVFQGRVSMFVCKNSSRPFRRRRFGILGSTIAGPFFYYIAAIPILRYVGLHQSLSVGYCRFFPEVARARLRSGCPNKRILICRVTLLPLPFWSSRGRPWPEPSGATQFPSPFSTLTHLLLFFLCVLKRPSQYAPISLH